MSLNLKSSLNRKLNRKETLLKRNFNCGFTSIIYYLAPALKTHHTLIEYELNSTIKTRHLGRASAGSSTIVIKH